MIAPSQAAALVPLSSRQRQMLAGLAALAYKNIAPDEDFNDWRHDQVRKVTGCAGLRECANEHFLPLKAHFHDLLGNADTAFRAAFKSANEPRSWALFRLYAEVSAMKDVMPNAMAYVHGFLKKKRGLSLDDADDRAIWHAIFTIRRKAQSLRKKKRGGESAGDVLAKLLGAGCGPKPRTTKGPF